MTPLPPLRRARRPDADLRARGWTMEYPCWWSCPGRGIRLTMTEAWSRQIAADLQALDDAERQTAADARAVDGGGTHGLLQPARSGIIQSTTERAEATGATNADGPLSSPPDSPGGQHG